MHEFAVMVGGRRVTLVQYRGDLDVPGTSALRDRFAGLDRTVTDVVVIDLSRVTSVDCAALSVLVDLAAAFRRVDVGLAVSGLPDFSRRLLSALDTERGLCVVGDMVAATHWAATWTPVGTPTLEPRQLVLPPGPRRCAPAGPERPWYEWH